MQDILNIGGQQITLSSPFHSDSVLLLHALENVDIEPVVTSVARGGKLHFDIHSIWYSVPAAKK